MELKNSHHTGYRSKFTTKQDRFTVTQWLYNKHELL